MARGVNKAIIIGNIGADIEVRQTSQGQKVVNLSVATTERVKQRDGEVKEYTEWHRVVCWSGLAEMLGSHARKGSRIYVEGSIQTRKWQDKSGHDRYQTEIVARTVILMDGRSAQGGQGGQQQDSVYRPPSAPPQRQDVQAGDSDGFHDDIPF